MGEERSPTEMVFFGPVAWFKMSPTEQVRATPARVAEFLAKCREVSTPHPLVLKPDETGTSKGVKVENPNVPGQI
jgi:hypothetical protein